MSSLKEDGEPLVKKKHQHCKRIKSFLKEQGKLNEILIKKKKLIKHREKRELRKRKKLERIEKEKEKQLEREEKKEHSQKKVYEAKRKMKFEMKEMKKLEKRKKIAEEKKKSELERQAELLKVWESNRKELAALDEKNLVPNAEHFECPICFTSVTIGEGVVLHDCLHSFCKDCLMGLVQHSEIATVKCPFQNEDYACDSCLQDREIKSLVTPEMYEKHLQRSVTVAECQAPNSFHCKTSDCPVWCLYEDDVNMFLCPTCSKNNCLTCAAIHEGMNCKQYQDYITLNCDTNDEAKETKKYLQDMVGSGEAMKCPQCNIVIMKKYGCDFMTCTMCQTDICWVTKGRRWGPLGKGDVSGGCKCKVNGVLCHPNCRNCH